MFHRVTLLQGRFGLLLGLNHFFPRTVSPVLAAAASSQPQTSKCFHSHSHNNHQIFLENFQRNSNLDNKISVCQRSIHTTTGAMCSKKTGGASAGASSPQPVVSDWKKLTDAEWAERLSPEAYFVAREAGTEPPFSGKYVNHKADGVYKCTCCETELFLSKTKFDSGSGWPSFYAAIDDSKVIHRKDISHGMVRTEVLCSTCNAHLGHLFEDGPEPTGLRYCMNSICLKFVPKRVQ